MDVSVRAPKRRKGRESVGTTTHVGTLTLTAKNDCEEVMLCVLSKQFSPLVSKPDKAFMEWISEAVRKADKEFAKRQLRVFATKKASVANE